MVLVDSSVWISYFRTNKHKKDIEYLLDEKLVITNELILVEVIPALKLHNKLKLISVLENIEKLPLNINWKDIRNTKVNFLKQGVSGIGIVDMIIAQNAVDNNADIFSEDKHFKHLQKVLNFSLYMPL